jgi:hypothetical protein
MTTFHPVGLGGFPTAHSQIAGVSGQAGGRVPVILEGFVAYLGQEGYPSRALRFSDKQGLAEHLSKALGEIRAGYGINVLEGISQESITCTGGTYKARITISASDLVAFIEAGRVHLSNFAVADPKQQTRLITGRPLIGMQQIRSTEDRMLQVRATCNLTSIAAESMSPTAGEPADIVKLRTLIKASAWCMGVGEGIKGGTISMHPEAEASKQVWTRSTPI